METCQTFLFVLVGQPSIALAKSDKLDACEGNMSDIPCNVCPGFMSFAAFMLPTLPLFRPIARRYLLSDQSQHGGTKGATKLLRRWCWRSIVTVTRYQAQTACAEEGVEKATQKSMDPATCLSKPEQSLAMKSLLLMFVLDTSFTRAAFIIKQLVTPRIGWQEAA